MKQTAGQPSSGAGARDPKKQLKKKPANLPQEQNKKKHPGGRPSKLTPQIAVKIFALSRKGLTDKEIAGIVDIDEKTIHNWKVTPEFFQSLKEAKGEFNSLIERSLAERAHGYDCPETKILVIKNKVVQVEIRKHYPPDPASMIFFLKNREPSKWRERVELPENIADTFSSIVQMMRKNEEKKNSGKK